MNCKEKARFLIDCPKCGRKPPVVHCLGGGPGFDGIRVCGHCNLTWDDDNVKYWLKLHQSKEKN